MLLAAAAAFAGASLQSATGFGFALVLAPALFAALDRYEAITALLVLGAALNLLVLADSEAGAVRGRTLAPALAAALPGLAAGVAVLAAVSKPALQVAVGLAVMAAAALQARHRGALRIPALVAGFASGTLTTSISVSGPPLVLWLESLRLSPAEVRASLAAAFLALNVAGALVFLLSGAGGRAAGPGVLAALLAALVAGHLAGALLFRRLHPERIRAVLLAAVFAAGAASVVAGLA